MSKGLVYILDDDAAICRALQRMLTLHGYASQCFRRPEEFLDRSLPVERLPACAIVDVCMPGLTGMQIQQHLQERGEILPLIFITGQADVPSSVLAMKRGAIDFLLKPFREAELITCVGRAMHACQVQKAAQKAGVSARQHYEQLTVREAEVLNLMVQGLPNKLVADQLGIAEKTVKIHRARVMEKMETHNLVELIRMVDALKARADRPGADRIA